MGPHKEDILSEKFQPKITSFDTSKNGHFLHSKPLICSPHQPQNFIFEDETWQK